MALPADYQTCRITGSWVDIATGEPGSGFVVLTPRAARITTGSEVIVLPTARRVWLVDGAIDIDVPATDDPDVVPVNWTYQVLEVIGGVEYPVYDIEAPAGGAVDLSDVVGVGSTGTIVTLTANGFVDLPETAATSNPATDHKRLIARTDGLYVRDEAGTEVGPLGAGGSGIAATIVDAAGDLIIGTAADTVARLAVGTSGQALTSNGTTAAWAMPWTATHAPTITATAIGSNESCVYSTPGQRAANTNHGLTAAGAEVWVPLPFDAGTYDRISVCVTTAAVSTWRIGLDSMATNGKFAPGANVLDAGTLNMNTGTGHQALNISLTIPTTGIYWARVLCTAYTGSPGTVNLDGNSGNSWASMVCRGWPSSPASYLRGFVGHVGSTGGTGAFAATPAPAVLGTVLPVVYFRRAS